MSRQNHLFQKQLSKKEQLRLFDKVAIVVSFVYPLSGVPQAIDALSGNVAGVSILSWIGFLLFSSFFVVYGVAHNLKPIIITNTIWVFIDALVVFGVLINS
jgi:uncharacterized protein with PQ loop repeat